jgi:trehalose 6-phosphate phosphatase
MRNILSQGNRDVLARVSWSSVLLAFDYDGTLAPIVADPHRATMRTTTATLLGAVAKLYPVVVISGRGRRDVLTRLREVEVEEVVGNHGIEFRCGGDPMAGQVQRWVNVLQPQLASWQGVQIEAKDFSLSVHYRRSRAKRGALSAILAAAAELVDGRVVGGKLVVNVLPQGGPDKGIALQRERERLRCDTAIYVGDDETDEDVFSLDQPGRLLSIRVGRSKASAAAYCVPGQSQIDDLLRTLVDLRRHRLPGRRTASR